MDAYRELLELVLCHRYRCPWILFIHHMHKLFSRSCLKRCGFKSLQLGFNVIDLYKTMWTEVSLNLWSFLVSISGTSLNHSLPGARSGTSDAHSSPEKEGWCLRRYSCQKLKLKIYQEWSFHTVGFREVSESPRRGRDSSTQYSPCQSPVFNKITL